MREEQESHKVNKCNIWSTLMTNTNSFNKLQVQLCELKLEERRVKSDITKLVRNKQMIDFYQAQQLNSQRTNLKNKIQKIETLINPNIIA